MWILPDSKDAGDYEKKNYLGVRAMLNHNPDPGNMDILQTILNYPLFTKLGLVLNYHGSYED